MPLNDVEREEVIQTPSQRLVSLEIQHSQINKPSRSACLAFGAAAPSPARRKSSSSSRGSICRCRCRGRENAAFPVLDAGLGLSSRVERVCLSPVKKLPQPGAASQPCCRAGERLQTHLVITLDSFPPLPGRRRDFGKNEVDSDAPQVVGVSLDRDPRGMLWFQ